MKTVLRAAGHAVRPAPARHRARGGAGVRERGRLPAGGQAAGRAPARRRPTGSTTPDALRRWLARRRRRARTTRRCWRSSWSARSTRSTASRSAARRSGRRSSDYLPPPLEVLRNPWIQWTVVLPRDIERSRVRRASARSVPRRCGRSASGTRFTHMEWFRRPDGSVAVSEVGARPPGAQLASMLGYAHDVDFYRVWARAGAARPVRPARAPVRRRHGVPARAGPRPGARRARRRRAAARARSPRRRGEAAAARAAGVVELRGRGLRHRPRPGHRGGPGRPAPHRQPGSASSSWRRDSERRDALAGLSRPRWRYFTRALAAVGATVIGVGDQPPSRRCRPRPGTRWRTTSTCRWPTRTRCSRRCTACPGTRGSTRSSASGSRTWSWRPASGRRSGCPGMTVEQTMPFRDKERMKQVLDAAGIRTPRHASATTRRRGVGGRRADRLPADRQADRRRRLGRHLPGRLRRRAGRRAADAPARPRGERRGVHRRRGVHLRHHLREREVLFENICWYRPRPLQTQQHEWISPITISLRDLDRARICRAAGRWARAVLGAGLPDRLHPHGVVPQGRRRGRSSARSARGRPAPASST